MNNDALGDRLFGRDWTPGVSLGSRSIRMNYTVILTEKADGSYYASVPALPDCRAKAETRVEALDSVRQTIVNFISRSEVVKLDVHVEPKSGALHQETPWEFFGGFQDDRTWGPLFDEIENYRNSHEG